MSFAGDTCAPTYIKILRDTGAFQSLILADVLPFSEKSFSGFCVLIQGVECEHIKGMRSLNLINFWIVHVYARFTQTFERNVYKY